MSITTPQPQGFAKALGFGSNNITVQAIAVGVPLVPAILALGAGCATGGMEGSSPSLTINGNVAANAGIISMPPRSIAGAATYATTGAVFRPIMAAATVTGGSGAGPSAA